MRKRTARIIHETPDPLILVRFSNGDGFRPTDQHKQLVLVSISINNLQQQPYGSF